MFSVVEYEFLRSDEVLSRILVFVSIVVIVESLSLSDVSVRYQKNSTFTIYIVPHAFHVLFLLPTPEYQQNKI